MIFLTGIPAYRPVTVPSRLGIVTAVFLGKQLASLTPSPAVASNSANAFLASQDLPYDYCFAANSSLIPSTSVQPSDCNCYIQLRAADKSRFPDDIYCQKKRKSDQGCWLTRPRCFQLHDIFISFQCLCHHRHLA